MNSHMPGRRTSRRQFLRALPAAVAVLGMVPKSPASAAERPPAASAPDARRCGFWIDLLSGEPISEKELFDDLATVRVIYLGERHTVQRHHDLEAHVVTELANRGVRLVLGLEQMEAVHQPTLDRYVKKQLSFDQLAETTQWSERWRGYEQYKPVLEAAQNAQSLIVALNARAETIRQVARSGGVERLAPSLRRELPDTMQLKDPAYERFLRLQMMVHASASAERLRPMVEAQIARDEAMAFVLASLLASPAGRGRTAVVVCGSGHVDYGLGTPARVRRRMPGVKDRTVLLSESGDVELTPEEKAVARPIAISHNQLRELDRPIGDYLHAASPKSEQ